MSIFRSGLRRWSALLALVCLLFTGCGDSIDDIALDLTPDDGYVAHQSWGGYRLYRYDAGSWRTVVDFSTTNEQLPTVGERPVVILHGLGSRIDTGRFSDLAENLVANGATSVFGFEYDSLDPIETNGVHFRNALTFLTQNEKNRVWRFVGHSMGALVARSAFESGTTFDMDATNNIACFPAGPHLGSPIAAQLSASSQNVVDSALQDAVLNGELDFRNADNTPVKVTGDEPSLAQLAPNSAFLNALNGAINHPQFSYRTMAGNERGDELEALNRILGVFADDGLVDVESANAAGIGPVQTDVVPYDHTEIVGEQPSILVILDQLDMLVI